MDDVERRRGYKEIFAKLEAIQLSVVEIKTQQEDRVLPDLEHVKKQIDGNGNKGLARQVAEHEENLHSISDTIKEFKQDKKDTTLARVAFVGSLLTVVGAGIAGFTTFYGNICALRVVVDTLVKTVDKLVK